MNEENTDGLIRDFPKVLFKIETIDCGDGWEWIIREAFEKLELLLKSGVPAEQNIYVTQIKEKFGGLRIYRSHALVFDFLTNDSRESFIKTDASPAYSRSEIDQVDLIIEAAQIKSRSICELCGRPGEQRAGNWIRTLCDEDDRKQLI